MTFLIDLPAFQFFSSQDLFSFLDKALIEHYTEKERLLGPIRESCTPKEIFTHFTGHIIEKMDWADRGQCFGKLSTEQLKSFMKQEKIPFFVKINCASDIKKYNR